MPTNITNPADPDGQSVMEVLTHLEVPAEEAYNATQGIRNMAGQNVTAKLESMEATIKGVEATIEAMDARINARIDTLEASTNARLDTLEATTSARLDMLEASTNTRIDALATQVDILGWAVMATLALVTALSAKGFLGRRKKRRSRKADKKSRSNHRPSHA